MVSVFISISLKIQPTIFVLLIAGIGTVVSGLIMKFNPLTISGVLFFVFAIASIFVDKSTILLINTIAILTGYLIPAYLLKKSK